MNACPIPDENVPCITMAHGGGGRLTERLVRDIFAPALGLDFATLHDGAEPGADQWVMSTDAHVVHPLFFSGGDIGALAAHGTCNDLAMAGAAPRWLTVSWIIEEGLPLDTLRRVATSLQAAARESGARIVAGDTKVVERGKGDGLYLGVSGAGHRQFRERPGPWRIQPGQALLLSGDVARHGVAVMSAREGGLGFSGEIPSDCAALWPLVRALSEAGIEPVCLRDCTRGGLATVLAELSEASGQELVVHEDRVVVREEVRGACELLGLDPLYVANEGCFLAILEEAQAEQAARILRSFPAGQHATVVGRVSTSANGRAIGLQPYGTSRVLDRLAGEPLPRIC
jgi:hydrogenase expression/formation protein HypE